MKNLLDSGWRSGHLYRSFFDQMIQATFLLDQFGRVFKGNPACQVLNGYSVEEWEGSSFWKLAVSEEQEMVRLQTQFAMNGDPRPFYTAFRHKDGTNIPVHITYGTFWEEGTSIGYYAMVQRLPAAFGDGYGSKRCRVLDISGEGAFIYHAGELQYVNQAGMQLVGASGLDELLWYPFQSFFHPRDVPKIKGLLRILEQGETAAPIEVELIRLDGSRTEVEVCGTSVPMQDKPSMYILIRDITERKRAQEFLQNSEKLALVGQLAAGIAHEIRNPLTSLKGFVQLMQKDGMRKPEYFSIMSSELARIEMIVSELLVLAKPHTAVFEARDLTNLITHVVTLLETEAILKKVMIQVVFESEVPLIHCDENQLKQAFINFLKNGIEATAGKGEIVIRLRCEDDRVVIRFEDNGVGIPAHQLARLGEAFFTTKETGTGLGLMVSRKIIENHRGTLRLISTPGNGTAVEVCLPISS
ncbi:PAS domain-containing sensor histidine kinase [Brevibacillus porteri]|uniref:histidine kinase n=1 Tax=Brevibacillus porteri TaxID=2126350 RepID=A0ABX5FW38_9BACL|nr:PAS domain-containing sensor histidine kinase [Brevibacillus porteri]MED1797638.1 PAS domain S-box protein [Brevibacillus porteri]MED2130622.1 PAS domain S-box protein [Brevibacillus porteri]MED2746206.1 PAS domain S-box protein [Brevibacillus porteri]MED2818000.1 PAS domain S-box protein [Brevibacillus porteri]MED2895165.1 PAS domain S-box protein [Brevibacillus porteri]